DLGPVAHAEARVREALHRGKPKQSRSPVRREPREADLPSREITRAQRADQQGSGTDASATLQIVEEKMRLEISEVELRLSQSGIVPIQQSDAGAIAGQNDLPWVKVAVEKRLAEVLILAARELVLHERAQLHERAGPLRRKRRLARAAACLLQH